MHKPKQPPVAGVVTSDAVYRNYRRWLVMAGVGAAVVLLAAAGWYGYYSGRIADFVARVRNAGGQQTAQLTPEQAISRAKEQVDSAKTAADKAAAYRALGAAYASNNQNNDAITSYQSAVSTAPDDTSKASSLSDLADSYLRNGDKQQAIDALQQLVALYEQSSDPNIRALVPKYQNLIQELQGPDTVPGS